jgi:Tol biopolymer transport system component
MSVQNPTDPMPQIEVVQPDGAIRRVGVGWDPDWAPGCGSFAYVRQLGTSESQIVVASRTSKTSRVLVSSNTRAFYEPRWSPDGSMIAYTSAPTDGSPRDVIVVPATGGTGQALTPTQSDDFSPTWSPDGQEIALIRVPNGTVESAATKPPDEMNQVWSMRVNGSALTRLTAERGGAWEPAWDPRSGRLVYLDSAGRLHMTTKVDGSSTRFVTVGSAPHPIGAARWLPDGNILLELGGSRSHLSVGPATGPFADLERSSSQPPLVGPAAGCSQG